MTYAETHAESTTRLFFWSSVDISDTLELHCVSVHVQDMKDRRGKRGLAMVNVTDGTNVYVWLVSLKYVCHITFYVLIY
jgi:hypothetical protein